RAFPQPVRQALGYALYLAQMGEKHLEAKPLKGFGGAGGLEAVDDHAGETYRAVYTVKFAEAVYVLHAFQKKSVRGRATSQRDIDLIKARLQWAQEHYAQWQHAPHTRQR
ncbi:MAG: type II toxin-antitoxin system RelE/ParE family toxin, partial [Candidatus Tectomicrobia bacterium]|nr:type II toxin-antitoxin system RelE/ParE family toxin [Candidatus Tectomicrobia bacterium]